tara:strand:- start:4574 stop:4753 length:180 start_codon:yes stop_codon:yes gene_type:complete
MSRKDYETLAAALREARPSADAPEMVRDTWTRTVSALSYRFLCENPRFNAVKFRAACWA